MRLIDADALKKDLRSVTLSNGTLLNTNTMLLLLDKYPTAYDVDEVIQQIEQLRMQYFLTIANTVDKALDVAYEKVYQALDKAIEIVKAGGKNDK